MNVLVINCGSSSLKYQVLDMRTESLLAKGLVERIGIEGSIIIHEKTGDNEKFKLEVPMANHTEAIAHVLEAVTHPEHGVVKSMDEIGAVGHRVVHAGEKYCSSVVITDDVITALEECIELAPLHNPPNLAGIAACKALMPTHQWWGFLTQHIIRRCLQSLIFMQSLMNIMKNIASEDMDSTEQAINMLQKEQLKFLGKTLKILN